MWYMWPMWHEWWKHDNLNLSPLRVTKYEYSTHSRVSSFERVSAATDKQFPNADTRGKPVAEEPLPGITPPALTQEW